LFGKYTDHVRDYMLDRSARGSEYLLKAIDFHNEMTDNMSDLHEQVVILHRIEAFSSILVP